MHEMVSSFGSEMAAVVSRNGTELDFPTVKGGNGTTPMESLVDYIDRALSAIWQGSDLSTMSRDNDAVGSLAQNNEADTLELDDCERISDTLNKQLIHRILKYALGTDNVLIRFELDVSDLESTGDELKVDQGLFNMGFEHSVNDLSERYGRKVPEDGEDTLSKAGKSKKLASKEKDSAKPAVKLNADQDEILPNVAGGDHWKNQDKSDRGRFGATFVSPNVGEDMPIEETMRRGDSVEQGASLSMARDIDGELGLSGSHYTAWGDWKDGSENTVYGEYSGVKDFDEIEYAAAVRGLIHDQKAVIAFQASMDGADAIYFLEETGLSINQARDLLEKAGIENRTLVTTQAGVRIVIFDKGSQLEFNVIEVANETKTNIKKIRGRGEFIGDPNWDQRSVAKKAYHGIIEAYETKWPDRRHHRTGRIKRLRNSDGTSEQPTLGNEQRVEKKGFVSWLGKLLLGNEGGNEGQAVADDLDLDKAREALQKDFEPLAAEIAAALNEPDDALRKALLLKIAQGDIPESDC